MVTSDVEPYEQMKLRLLNGSTFRARLSGGTARIRPGAHRHVGPAPPSLMSGRSSTVRRPGASGSARHRYRGLQDDDHRTLLEPGDRRPDPSAVPRRLRQAPQVRASNAPATASSGGPIGLTALALAGWCQYLVGVADDGSVIEPAERPHLETARQHALSSLSDPARFLDSGRCSTITWRRTRRLVDAFSEALTSIRKKGTNSAIESALRGGWGAPRCGEAVRLG